MRHTRLSIGGLLFALLVAYFPAGTPARAATAAPTRPAIRINAALAPAAPAPVPAPSASPAPAMLQATPAPTPVPTMSGTMPPSTVPPTPSPPPPTTPTPHPAAQFWRIIDVARLPLRSAPSSTATTLVRVPHGQIAGVLGVTRTSSGAYWFKATYRGKTGYAPTRRFQRVILAGRELAAQYPRVIVVARRQQHMEVWQNGRLMLISAVTTGRPELPTPLGTTKVIRKESPHLFISPWKWPSAYWYPPGWADYAVLFRSGGFYFHDTEARPENGYGIGTNVPHVDPDGVVRTGSRGCVNTPYWAVRSLYGWATQYDPVVILDV